GPPVATSTYPSRRGFDEFFGYGRANVYNGVGLLAAGKVPPEAEIESPGWYDEIDPSRPGVTLRGYTFARGSGYTCTVEVAPGSEPNNASTAAGGDFEQIPSPWCDGKTVHTTAFDGPLATIDLKH